MDAPAENERLVLGMLDVRSFAFPVISMAEDEGDEVARPLVFGTAFCVGPGIFVTAGHVIADAVAVGKPAIGVQVQENRIRPARAVMHEILDAFDVGVMACRAEALGLLNWAEGPVSMGSDVGAVGFPYSVDWDHEVGAWKLVMRTFKGYVITRRRIWRLAANPLGYEVDCPFHPGLSGAPLIDATGPIPELKLIGMVLGEQRTKFAGRRICFGEALDVLSLAEVSSTVAGTMLARLGAQSTPAPVTLGQLREFTLARGIGRWRPAGTISGTTEQKTTG